MKSGGVFSIYSVPLRPVSWAGMGVALATFGTIVFVLSLNREEDIDKNHGVAMGRSIVFVFFSFVGKVVSSPWSESVSARAACVVVSFGGFVLISLYR